MRDLTHIKVTGFIEDREVFINDKRLRPETSQAAFNHSPDGFSWGYTGSGCAQLALAILMEFIPYREAFQFHQAFKESFVAFWNKDEDFTAQINLEEWLERHQS